MCMSWKYLFCIMDGKCRKLSLDSSICLDSVGVIDRRKGSRWFGKKSREFQSLDDARLKMQELNQSLALNMSPREKTISEENIERPDGRIHRNSFLKHNKTFHKLFHEIPEGENLTHTFTCALQKEVLYHGKLFVSKNHLSFHSSVLLKETKVVILAPSVQEVKKHNSALSMLSVHTADGEKFTFVSLRNREMCYKLLHIVFSHLQGKSGNQSPPQSSAENEADHDVLSSYSSLEDSVDRDLSRQNSITPEDSFPQMSSEAPTRHNSTRQNSLTGEDDSSVSVSWIWRITEMVAPLFFLREIRNLSLLFYVYMMLYVGSGTFWYVDFLGWLETLKERKQFHPRDVVIEKLALLLLVSGYIGLRIIELEEQLIELSVQQRDYQQT